MYPLLTEIVVIYILHDQIRDAQRSGDDARLDMLMQEFHLLIKKG